MSSDVESEPIKRLAADRSSYSRLNGDSTVDQGETEKYRVKAANPFQARTHPSIPRLYTRHSVNPRVFASAIEARYVAKTRNEYDVVVNYTPRQTGEEEPQDPKPGDEFWESSSISWTEHVYQALGKPEVIYEDSNAPVDSGNLIGLNPRTGEVSGCDDECGGVAITITQYRSEEVSRGSFMRALAECNKKVNAQSLFGYPPRCVMLYDFRIQAPYNDLKPITYIFHVRPPVDLSEINITKSDGTEKQLSGSMGGYEYLDRLVGEKPTTDGKKTLHYTRKVQICRVKRTSNFTALGLSGELR